MSRRNLPCSNKILWKTCSFSLFLVTIWNFLSMMRIESRALRILQSRSYQMVLHFYHFFFASGSFILTFALKRFTFLQEKVEKCVPLPQSSLWPISNHVLCIVTLHETNCNHCNQIFLFTRMYINSYAHNSLLNTFIWEALPFYLPSLFS